MVAKQIGPRSNGAHGGTFATIPNGGLAEGNAMELKTSSSRYYQTVQPTKCAQCRNTIFLPEWSEYLNARVRHLWVCEACGYKFETLVCFPGIA
jgi:hypothetical protein